MIKKSKTKHQHYRQGSKKELSSAPSLSRVEVENVEYFLRALNQISLALRALGYMSEGDALTQVKADLHRRMLWSPDGPEAALEVLH